MGARKIYTQTMQLLTIIVLCLCSIPGYAGNDIPSFVSFKPSAKQPKLEGTFDVFLISTEIQIGKVRGLVEHAPQGAYITVGAERGFRGASMTPKITHLFLMDVSPDIHRFNRINTELLKANTREEYRNLRWKASYEQWQSHKKAIEAKYPTTVQLSQEDFDWWVKRVRNLENMSYPLPEVLNRKGHWPYPKQFSRIRNILVRTCRELEAKTTVQFTQKEFLAELTREEIQQILKSANMISPLTDEEWEWWYVHGRDKSKVCSKLWLEHPEQALNFEAILNFRTGNYLFDDALYQRLHHLALSNRIKMIDIDLKDQTQVEKLVQFLKRDQLQIGVLDLNNLMVVGYIGQQNYHNLLQNLLPLGQKDSDLIAMKIYKDYGCAEFQIYIGFTFENVRHWSSQFKLQSFIENIPDEVYPLIDMKLFEGKEEPNIGFKIVEQ